MSTRVPPSSFVFGYMFAIGSEKTSLMGSSLPTLWQFAVVRVMKILDLPVLRQELATAVDCCPVAASPSALPTLTPWALNEWETVLLHIIFSTQRKSTAQVNPAKICELFDGNTIAVGAVLQGELWRLVDKPDDVEEKVFSVTLCAVGRHVRQAWATLNGEEPSLILKDAIDPKVVRAILSSPACSPGTQTAGDRNAE